MWTYYHRGSESIFDICSMLTTFELKPFPHLKFSSFEPYVHVRVQIIGVVAISFK